MDDISYIRSNDTYHAEFKTIPQGLMEMAQANPDKEIVVFYSPGGVRESITFSELYNKSQQFGRILLALGVRKGDRVIIRLYNSMEWLVIIFGLMSIGAVPVSSYIARKDVSDLNHVIQQTEAVGLFFAETNPDIVSAIKQIMQTRDNKMKFAVSTVVTEDDGPLMSYCKMLENGDTGVDMSDVCLDPDDEAYIMRTSGTTGRPKLISHSHMTLRKYASYLVNPGQKQFSNASFSWLGGTPIIQVCIGETKVTTRGAPGAIPVDEMLQYAEKESCALLELTTYDMNLVLQNELKIPKCVKTVVLGGSPIKKKFQSLLDNVECLLCGYATLETGDISKVQIKKGMTLEDNIAGYPSQGVEIKIVDEKNSVIKIGMIGHVFTRSNSNSIFLEYVGDEKMTREKVSPSRWYNTGDMGFISQSGMLYVIGRNCECVTRNTANIQVSDIERLIAEAGIDCIEDLVVVPVPDEMFGQEICACIIRKPNYTETQADILQIFDNTINNDYFKPKFVVFVDRFPITPSGKVNRKMMCEIAMETFLEKKNTQSN